MAAASIDRNAQVISNVDYSMIGTAQVVNLCLQRSNLLKKIIPKHPRDDPAWPEVMQQTATIHREAILAAVTSELSDMFDQISPTIALVAPRRFADLGCGQAFIDLFIHRKFGCDLVLIDIETSDDIHFGFAAEGSGYADLANAKAFLAANGVPDNAITIVNPRNESLAAVAPVDMAMSLISCGFHYPVATYDDFFRTQVSKAIMLDCRNRRGEEKVLARYGRVTKLGDAAHHSRFLCEKT